MGILKGCENIDIASMRSPPILLLLKIASLSNKTIIHKIGEIY